MSDDRGDGVIRRTTHAKPGTVGALTATTMSRLKADRDDLAERLEQAESRIAELTAELSLLDTAYVHAIDRYDAAEGEVTLYRDVVEAAREFDHIWWNRWIAMGGVGRGNVRRAGNGIRNALAALTEQEKHQSPPKETKYCLCSDPDYCLRYTPPDERELAIAYRKVHGAPLPRSEKDR